MKKWGKFSALWQLRKSKWFFPGLLTVVLLLLTAFQISGSSIGNYYPYFNGTNKDPQLLLNHPEPVRSDEWLVNTQLTIAQSNNHFARINHNIGNGEDMSTTVDVPYKEWSELFKPQNWAFFVMPLGYALAFKWWLMAYLVVMGCYFFVLCLLPKRRLLAALISSALLFGAFIQWWYLYFTIGSVYYTLFICVVVMQLLKQQRRRYRLLLTALLAYLLTCFALVMYPPFQISCALAAGGFLVGYALEQRSGIGWRELGKRVGLVLGALIIAGSLTLTYIETRSKVIITLNDTAYPGTRELASGGFSVGQLMSGNLGRQFLAPSYTAAYRINGAPTNQSEAANFILLLPFLFLPSLYLLADSYRKERKIDWPLLAVNATFVIFLLQMFATWFEPFAKLLVLDKVGYESRLLIGVGLLSTMQLVLVMRHLLRRKSQTFAQKYVIPYAILVFVAELALDLHAKNEMPGFITTSRALLFAIPVPVIVYLALRKKFALAALGFLCFSLFTSAQVNPLYHGTAVLTQNPIVLKIKSIAAHSKGRWIAEGIYLENFPAMSGAPSLSGVYGYPQFALWDTIPGISKVEYNRYAHVNFNLKKTTPTQAPSLQLIGPDHFIITAGACSTYLQQEHVEYILTQNAIQTSCTQRIDSIRFKTATFYIYKIND